jgi:hypothetical protein
MKTNKVRFPFRTLGAQLANNFFNNQNGGDKDSGDSSLQMTLRGCVLFFKSSSKNNIKHHQPLS